MSDIDYMKIALKEAEEAFIEGEVPVGAIIVSNGQIIACTHNLTQTLNDVTAHAEIQAITAAADFLGNKYLTECALYVTLEPCIMCAGAIAWSQMGRLIYGAPDPRKGFTMLSENILHKKTKVTSALLAAESIVLLKNFFKEKRDL
ncbi:MAG: nucleoside deaminase [Bacteroidales bacterium]|jgi:tRNA(adenine34) deaminase|nr:nucleoside deaminase [Bacteroidales bacterium]